MIVLRRSEGRLCVERPEHGGWLSFDPRDRTDPLAGGFGGLQNLGECLLAPRARILARPGHDAESVVYVREGVLAFEDSTGCSGVLLAGEFQRVAGGPGFRRSEENGSRTHWAHVFQAWLRSSEAGLEAGLGQRRFSAAERRGGPCLVASPDARRGSLCVRQDVLTYSALLSPGQHVVHELAQGRGAWVHLVRGEVALADVALTTGDGVGVTGERSVSLTARDEAEILLFDVDAPRAGARESGGAP